LVLTGCPTESKSGDPQPTMSVEKLESAFDAANASGGGTVELTGNVTLPPHRGGGADNGVTIIVNGNGYTVNTNESGFGTDYGKIVFNNITIKSSKYAPISTGGTGEVVINNDVTITAKDTAGVWMGGGTFTMNGGKITGCTNAVETSGNETKNIVINGGEITGNSGIAINAMSPNSAVTIAGGTISGNGHLGVAISGGNSSITKTGGIIYGNDAGKNSNKAGSIGAALEGKDALEITKTLDESTNGEVTINSDGSDFTTNDFT